MCELLFKRNQKILKYTDIIWKLKTIWFFFIFDCQFPLKLFP